MTEQKNDVQAMQAVQGKKKLNIFQKMLNATNEIQTVAKNLNVQVNAKNSYKAVGERDILDAVKPIEFKNGIYSYPYSREIIKDEKTMSVVFGDDLKAIAKGNNDSSVQ